MQSQAPLALSLTSLLSPDILLEIARYLGLNDIACLMLINTTVKQKISADQAIWKGVTKQHFPFVFYEKQSTTHNWFAVFRQTYQTAYYPNANTDFRRKTRNLFTAAKDGDLAAIRRITSDNNFDLEWQDEKGQRLIEATANSGNQALLDYFYELNSRYHSTETLNRRFRYAATFNKIEEINTLIRKDVVNINARNAIAEFYGPTPNETPLFLAVTNNHLEVVKLLLTNNANPNIPNWKGATPLYTAAKNGHLGIFLALLEARALIEPPIDRNIYIEDRVETTPLIIAACYGHIEIVRAILKRYPTIINTSRQPYGTALNIAAKNGHFAIVRELLTHGTDIHAQHLAGAPHLNYKTTPLHLAAQYGHTEIIKMLLKKEEANKGYVNVPNNHSETPLLLAAQNGHHQAAQVLLKAGANPEIANYYMGGVTPLLLAADGGHLQTVQVLLEASANVQFTDKNGETAFYKAEKNGYNECAQALLAAGASVARADLKGNTPLHHAMQNRNIAVVNTLLNKTPNMINQPNNAGHTPLFDAVNYKKIACVQALLDRNDAAPFIDDKNIKAALNFAKKFELTEAVKVLAKLKLQNYIKRMTARQEKYKTTLTLFGHTLINFGYSRNKKLLAANAALNGSELNLSKKCEGALHQGELGAIYRLIKKGR